MMYPVGAFQSFSLSEGEKSRFINLSHSSSIFQHNYTMRIGNTLFLIDQKIESAIRGLFGASPLDDLTSSGLGSPIALKLKGTKHLTSQIVDNILLFFRRGSIERQKGDLEQRESLLLLVKACKRYDFPLLNSYLSDLSWHGIDNPFSETKFLGPFEKLELAALRQEPDMFSKLLDQYLETKGESSYEIARGEFFNLNFKKLLEESSVGESENAIADENEDAWDQSEIARVMIPFEVESFEKIASSLKARNHELYEHIVQAYAKAHQYCLDDLIHRVTDMPLKWDMIAHIPSLDIRMLWFLQLDAKASDENIESAIVRPLMAQGRFEEALKWAKKVGNQQLIMHAAGAASAVGGYLELSNDLVEVKIEGVVNSQSCLNETTLIGFIQDRVGELVTKTSEITGIFARRRLVQEFHESVETYLMETNQQGWTQPLLVCAIQHYIQMVAEMLVEESMEETQTKCAITDYGKQLHPAMMEDLQIIKALIKTVKDYLDKAFRTGQLLSILEDQCECLSESRVAEALIVHVRHLFQKRFSLREDFIVQEISNYLQPYFFKSDAPLVSKPFIERLEEKLSEARLGGELSVQEILLAKEIYIRKGLEVANYRYCHLGVHKLDPYETKNVADLRELKEALQIALRADFSENYLLRLSMDQRRSFEGPILMREVFVQAINSKFKAQSI